MSRVVVREVHPTGLHGFARGELELRGLGPDLNVVLAPNASGKSTLAKAIGLLFNAEGIAREALVFGSVLVDGANEELRAERKHRYGGFPGRASDYRLELVQLLQGFAKGESPLDTIIAKASFKSQPPVKGRASSEVTEAEAALRAMNEARRLRAAAAVHEDALPGLQTSAREALEASEALKRIEGEIDRRALQCELERLEELLGNLAERNPGIQRQGESAAEEAIAASRAVARAEEACGAAKLRLRECEPGERKPAAVLTVIERERLTRLLGELNLEGGALREARQRAAECDARATSTRDHLIGISGLSDADSLPAPTREDLELAVRVAQEQDDRRSEALRWEAARRALEDWNAKNAPSEKDLERLIRQLIAWLSIEPVERLDSRPALIAAILALGIALCVFTPEVGLRLAVAAAAIVLAGAVLARGPKAIAARPDLEGVIPGPIDHEVVVERLEQVLIDKAAEEVRSRLRAQSEAPNLEQRLDGSSDLQRRFQDPPLQFATLVSSLNAYLEARAGREAAAGVLSEIEGRLASVRQEISMILHAHEFECEPRQEPEAARSFLLWFERSVEVDRAERDVTEARAALQDCLSRHGLSDELSPEAATREILARTDLASEYREINRRALGLREDLATGLAAEFAGLGDEELRDRVLDLSEISQEYEARVAKYQAAKLTVENAERESPIGEREHAYREALLRVESRFHELVRDAVSARVQAAVQERLRKDVPELVLRAGKYLSRFTSGRFSLEVGDSQSDGLGMLAVKGEREELLEFDKLSTGTKVHAVIALRLASIAEQETSANGGRLSFPLIADEALAVSDPESREAIASALVEVAKERQVIVFTNQPQDAELFRRLDPGTLVHSLGVPASVR